MEILDNFLVYILNNQIEANLLIPIGLQKLMTIAQWLEIKNNTIKSPSDFRITCSTYDYSQWKKKRV